MTRNRRLIVASRHGRARAFYDHDRRAGEPGLERAVLLLGLGR